MRQLIKKGIVTYLNYKSFTTNRQLLIIESDDWGSLRTRDKQTRDKLNKISSAVKADRYAQLDSIADADDLSALFEVLNSVKDSKGNPACLTANVCTANPDFEAIKAVNFQDFYYTSFTQTLEEYSHREDLLKLWKNGELEKLFIPQLHGREHLHALAWLAELRAGNKDLKKAFELQSFGIPYKALLLQKRQNLQAALDRYNIEGEAEYQEQWIKDGAEIFKGTFGYASKSFIVPTYRWTNEMHKHLVEANVKTLQGIKLQYIPANKSNIDYHKKPHYTGEIDKKSGLIYTARNAFFEPTIKPEKDWVNETLQGVEKAFKKNQPAIIGSHRINYIGSLDERNRAKNLEMLKTILQKIVSKYPNIEFVSSAELAELIILNS
jgi:hypothetical protein